jgi:predicted Zn-dependent protease with MMP-like domain
MEREEFEKVVENVVTTLPAFIRKKLQNIDIVIEDEPVVHKSLLGLYQGVPLKNRGHWYGNVMPDRITIFKKNIERISHNEEELKEWIHRVIIHEIGHYFGFDEQGLRKSGN